MNSAFRKIKVDGTEVVHEPVGKNKMLIATNNYTASQFTAKLITKLMSLHPSHTALYSQMKLVT